MQTILMEGQVSKMSFKTFFGTLTKHSSINKMSRGQKQEVRLLKTSPLFYADGVRQADWKTKNLGQCLTVPNCLCWGQECHFWTHYWVQKRDKNILSPRAWQTTDFLAQQGRKTCWESEGAALTSPPCPGQGQAGFTRTAATQQRVLFTFF